MSDHFSTLRRLGPRDVVVCLARPEELDDPTRYAAALTLLSAEERARLDRFRFAADRQVALASRALQRKALSRCADVAPEAWTFVATARGKPEIAGPASSLRFNVSNGHGLVACAVTIGRDVGIDVEPIRVDAPADIIDSHFAPAERVALRALPVTEQPRRFVEVWTRKEAYLKARGLGMSVPLTGFWFDPDLVIAPELGDDPARWQVVGWEPTPTHCAALCVEHGGGAALDVVIEWGLL